MSAYANAIIHSRLSHARFSANLARKYRAAPESAAFNRGLVLGAIHVATYIDGADKDAAMAAEHEARFLLGDYLRRQA